MGDRITVEFEGVEGLNKTLADLPASVRDAAWQAILEAADSVRDETRDTVRVDEGDLQAGVEVRADEGDLTAEIGWWDPALYYAVFHEFGTSSVSANPALTQAGEAERGKLPGRLADAVKQAIT